MRSNKRRKWVLLELKTLEEKTLKMKESKVFWYSFKLYIGKKVTAAKLTRDAGNLTTLKHVQALDPTLQQYTHHSTLLQVRVFNTCFWSLSEFNFPFSFMLLFRV